MSKAPYFSIVTPTYNRAEFLGDAIKSIQAQSFDDYEHIIVDDGSTDDTEKLVASYLEKDSRIIYIKQENKGRSSARNVGIDRAKGEYVCFLDSDDYWKPEHLSTLNKAVKASSGSGMFVTGLIWFFEKENREQKVIYKDRNRFTSDVEFVIENQFAPDCVCIHHTIFEKHLFNASLYINEDLELWGRIAANYPVTTIKKNTSVLRVHGGNTSQTEKDYITHRMEVFRLQLAHSDVRKLLSASFVKNRWRSLRELSIRHQESIGNRWQLVYEIVRFLILYPQTPRNRAKLVMLLYSLPGGLLIKRMFGSK